MPNTNSPIGVVILARHGDRSGFYRAFHPIIHSHRDQSDRAASTRAEDPTSYSAADTTVTPLGEKQNYDLGALVRGIYTGSDPSRAISGLSPTTFDGYKINSTADAGGEGSVIYDSALAFWQVRRIAPPSRRIPVADLFRRTALQLLGRSADIQLHHAQGFYPPSPGISTITLANGTNITSPLDGYQYVQVNTVMPDDDIDFEPWTNCAVWANRTTEVSTRQTSGVPSRATLGSPESCLCTYAHIVYAALRFA